MLHHQSGASVADNTQDPLNQWSWFQTTLETARRKEETVRNSSDINSSVLSPPIVAPTSTFSVSIFQAFYIELSPTKQSIFPSIFSQDPNCFFLPLFPSVRYVRDITVDLLIETKDLQMDSRVVKREI